jgi:REP element-mobilizing transposase RayT
LTPDIRPQVYDCLQAECAGLRVDLVAIGGIEDHVHVLVRTPPSVAVSYLVQQLKGVSSHMVNHEIAKDFAFKWQGAYGAFSVSKRLLPLARNYIAHQEEHHRAGTLFESLEPRSTPPPIDPSAARK